MTTLALVDAARDAQRQLRMGGLQLGEQAMPNRETAPRHLLRTSTTHKATELL